MEPAIEKLTRDLPDREAALRFLHQLREKHPSHARKLERNPGLFSDVVTLVSYSPLIAATLLQNPAYFAWLDSKRAGSGVIGKDELLESLARFSLTNSQVETPILLARFCRRELIRIFLRDIRRLATIAEITEEISNLADAVLEFALRTARQEMDNRYGIPLEPDERGRSKPADICIVALGKLGSRELNYSSDIDLQFIYSAEGMTSGQGSRGAVTNREYFVKLAELVVKLIGGQAGEGAAYRVDLRLRPRGRIGALALSLPEAVRYYRSEARPWERQVLIRSRASAGDARIFSSFMASVVDLVFSVDITVDEALDNVRVSKQKIDLEQKPGRGFDVKLGRGGIREIEFIAQALQLAHGGRDRWLRSPHTLISLARLADRGHINERELTELADAYDFLRRLEHLLQMENGMQTHTLPADPDKRALVGRRMAFEGLATFDAAVDRHLSNVRRTFTRVFDTARGSIDAGTNVTEYGPAAPPIAFERHTEHRDDNDAAAVIERMWQVSPHFASLLTASPEAVDVLAMRDPVAGSANYTEALASAVESGNDLSGRLDALRTAWTRSLLEIAILDVYQELPLKECKKLQTKLAEASIAAALVVAARELSARYGVDIAEFPVAILALGKLGGGGIDYDSDLDLVVVYDENAPLPVENVTPVEYYGRVVDALVTALSGVTRHGHLYRVDLRLRPHGKSGSNSISLAAFTEYISDAAALWELLAFVKLRAVGGDMRFAEAAETRVRQLIHSRAGAIPEAELAAETRRIRLKLEETRSRGRRHKDVDIKYGPGGMLDVYFAVRYLQLRDNVPDDSSDRSTEFMLAQLLASGSLPGDDHDSLLQGYRFLSALDHQLRLTVSRTTLLPLSNKAALETIAQRLALTSPEAMLEALALHRLEIRSSFERVLS